VQNVERSEKIFSLVKDIIEEAPETATWSRSVKKEMAEVFGHLFQTLFRSK